MDDDISNVIAPGSEGKVPDVVYNTEKDFYKGIGGELRYKAEGLFKKAREKGISIEEIDVIALKEEEIDFPGIGRVGLPTYLIKVKGKHLQSGQVIVDGKQIDYYNRYQQYAAESIEKKSYERDEKGRVVKRNNRPVVKENADFSLTEWELFDVGKNLLDDKEFGMEKTITGACDRVIRKLMGENDWLYPGEARLLDEEFSDVQKKIESEQESARTYSSMPAKRATERQINYLKAKIKNWGVNPDDELVLKEILKQSGFEATDVTRLSTGDVSKIIDSVSIILPRVKESLSKKKDAVAFDEGVINDVRDNIKQ